MPDANEAAADIEEVRAWAAGLDPLHARIAGRFARAEPAVGDGDHDQDHAEPGSVASST